MSKLIVGLMLVLINCNVIAKNLTIKCVSEPFGMSPKIELLINVDEDNNKVYVSGPPIFDVLISPDTINYSQIFASIPLTMIIDRVSGAFVRTADNGLANDIIMNRGNCTKVITPIRKF